MGQASVKAVSDVKLNDTVIAVDKRFEGLLALELDAVKVRTAHTRELEIRELAFKTTPIKDTWLARIQTRLSAIVGGTANWEQASAIRMEIKVNQVRVIERQDSFRDEFLLTSRPSLERLRTRRNSRSPDVSGQDRDCCRACLVAVHRVQQQSPRTEG